MANTVIALKKSSTPGATPTNLANGELAINFADGKLFYKNTSSIIAEISGAGGGGGSSFGTINVDGTLIVSDTSGDILSLTTDENIYLTPDIFEDTITIGLSFNTLTLIQDSYDKANAANVLAFNTGIGANAFAAATIAGANAFAVATIAGANNIAIAAFGKANTGVNTFVALTDVPSSYANAAGYLVTVNPGGTGLQFTSDIPLDELIHTARVAPTTVANDSVSVYVTATGTSPNREVAYKIKNEYGEEVIISSILT